jgi:hypothetical protein
MMLAENWQSGATRQNTSPSPSNGSSRNSRLQRGSRDRPLSWIATLDPRNDARTHRFSDRALSSSRNGFHILGGRQVSRRRSRRSNPVKLIPAR